MFDANCDEKIIFLNQTFMFIVVSLQKSPIMVTTF